MKKTITKISVLVLLAILLASCTTLAGNDTGEPESNEPANAEEPSVATEQPMPTATLAPMGTEPAVLPTPESTQEVETVYIDLNTVYAEVVSSLPEGAALFNPAEKMRLGEVYPVEVRVVPVSVQRTGRPGCWAFPDDSGVRCSILVSFTRGGEIKKAIPVNGLEGIVQEVVIINHTEGEVFEGFFGDWLHFCQGDHVVVSSMIDTDGN